jgi:hypothetical protein
MFFRQNVGAEEVIGRWWAWLCLARDVAEAAAEVRSAGFRLVVRMADVPAASRVVATDARLLSPLSSSVVVNVAAECLDVKTDAPRRELIVSSRIVITAGLLCAAVVRLSLCCRRWFAGSRRAASSTVVTFRQYWLVSDVRACLCWVWALACLRVCRYLPGMRVS